eukprot:GFUD01104882.1.p1 GENE.GFUD01104882.1~~GFUD01104882.1.p1  ORF type:complete len:793 (+),score=264.49 GFUD01104882.1:241-2379(+)
MDNDADNHTANDATTATSASMVAHQAAVATSEACLTSMAAHQFYQAQYLEAVPAETVPQLDGMDDLDSEEDTNDNSTPAKTLPVHQEDTDASESANPCEVTSDDIQEDEAPDIECNPSSQENGDFLQAEALEQNAANNKKVDIEYDAEEETSAADDNQGLKEGAEVSPNSESPEIHDGIKAGEELRNDTFDDGSNLQNTEEVVDLDLGESVNAQEIYLHAPDANLPTEEAMDSYDDSDTDMLAHGAELLDDNNDADDNTGTEDSDEGAEDLDGSAEIIDDGNEEVEDEEILDDGAEVYEGEDVLDNYQEEYDYDEGEDEEMYHEESSSYGFSQPPVKRARMSSDAEVVLDSEDEEVTNVGVAAKPMPQQAQVRALQQQNMMARQQPMQSSGHSLSQQPHTASLSHQLTGRKRKLESAALCIKDGQVYFKPFTQLPKVLLNRKSTKHYPDRNTHKPSPLHPNTSKPTLQPYKHSVEIHQMVGQQGHRYAQRASKQESQQFNSGLNRIRQLPPGIVVHREEIRDSVEDDDEYHSDDPEEVIDGQEVEEDCDIIGEHTNNDVYSEEEEDVESCEVVQESEHGETHEDVDVQDESEEGKTNEDADVQEDSEEETHDNDSKENDSEHQEDPLDSEIQEDYVTHSTAEVDVEFEEASVDVPEAEACEENDKFDMVLEVKPSEETSEKQGDLIEAEQVANCNESQKDNDDLPAAALVAE